MAYLLQHLLSESAARFPAKEALRFEGKGITYTQLDELSDKIAGKLQGIGVNRGDRVGIYLHKSIASVISIFGILKAGGVYVPLDPNAPPKRLAYITRNCDIKVLLTSSHKGDSLDDFFNAGTPVKYVLFINADDLKLQKYSKETEYITWEEISNQDNSLPIVPDTIETDLAYILYTSGSTGNPKGVMISHRTIFTFINWCYEKFNITHNDRITSHAPLHFDLSTFDIFVTIKAGGTVVLVPEKLSIFPVQLVRLLQDENITVTYLVPSILSMMVNYGQLDTHQLPKLRTILFAGEVFPIKYLRELVAAIPNADYYNLYGPTETNVCTHYKVQEKDLDPNCTQPVPIGKACENISVFAVDDEGELVTKPGIEGELWVRGSCVAQGYWDDVEKTQTVFVKNPHQPNFYEFAYRTGDIVKLAQDGINWLFVGRRDHMIKSRGYRIELGEIEAALNNNEAVQESAVVAIPDDLIGNRIIAFIVLMQGSDLEISKLQSYLTTSLPKYMIPEEIEYVDSLPKTSTGKINRPILTRQLLST